MFKLIILQKSTMEQENKSVIDQNPKKWYDACSKGDINIVQSLISDNRPSDYRLRYCLYHACLGGHIKIVQFLISVAEDVNFKPRESEKKKLETDSDSTDSDAESNSDDSTTYGIQTWNCALAHACYNDNKELVNLLISKGADAWNNGFYNACENGHFEIVQLLISKGADGWDYGLHYACSGGCLKIVNLLISKIESLKFPCDWNFALCGACKGGHASIAKLVISKGASIFFDAFNCAHSHDHMHIIHLLLGYHSKENPVRDYVRSYFSWPRSSLFIIRLLYLKTPLDAFDQIYGYQDLKTNVSDVRQCILKSNTMLPDLLTIVSRYIII